jgi:hypothetical protein
MRGFGTEAKRGRSALKSWARYGPRNPIVLDQRDRFPILDLTDRTCPESQVLTLWSGECSA